MNKQAGIVIEGRTVGQNSEPFIIAEMSGNHNQSLERALALVDAAAAAGAHALKLQTYTPDTMTLDIKEREFFIEDRTSPWYGRTLYQLYEEAHTPWEWHLPLFERARARGLIPFSTPFDQTSIEFLETLNVPCYKIASFENTDLRLIRKVAATGKPLIISTGLATLAELSDTIRCAREAGCQQLILLKCTSNYPASPENSNLRTLQHMRTLFDCEVGLSDHTLGIGVAVASVALGASVIEKHFTLSRADGGVDSQFSLEPAEFFALVAETKRAWQGLGMVSYIPTASEYKSRRFRRTLYIVQNMRAGDVLSLENVRAIRPGLGLPVSSLDLVLGRRVKEEVRRGTALNWALIE